jgi:DMSO/TMAO reductase YedYZ molybdopterin-dependent catalytic subunit
MTLPGTRRGGFAGLVAGLAAVAAMYLASLLTGMRALPDLLQQPILALMPGPVFGFLIDNLQHAGKVIEEAGLIVAMLVALTVLGAAAGYASERFGLPRAGLLAGALGWLVVAVAVLPLAGQGVLGLAAGPTTPVVWALVFVVYWLVWELAWGTPGQAGAEAPFDPERRRMVTLLPLAIGGGSLVLLGVLKVPDWVRAIVAPPESGLTGPAPELTPVEHFYRVTKNFQDPVVPAGDWSLRVSGLVARPLKLGYRELQAVPATTQIVTMECISNDVGGNLMSTGRFTGIPLRDLLTMAELRSGAGAVNFRARDGYTESLPLSVVMGAPEIVVAHQLNGSPLPDGHGFPARMLIPGRYGMKGPKWLESIDVAAAEAGGFWEGQGWDDQAVVRTTSRFDTPRAGALLRGGSVLLAGVAFAGTRGVQAVEWSGDGGRTWSPADLKPPLSPLTWVLWTAQWQPAGEGVHTLVVRARDGGGALQTSQLAPSYPAGATGYHTIQVTVGGR